MLNKIKKLVGFMLCAALLFTLIIVPTEAATAGLTAAAIDINWDDKTTGGFASNTTIANVGGTHGNVIKLGVKTSDLLSTASDELKGGDGVTAYTDAKDQVFSADFYLPQTDASIALILRNPDNKNSNQTFLLFNKYGNIHVRPSGGATALASDSAAQENIVGSYSANKWHNITIYYDFDTTHTDGKKAYYFLDGVQVTSHTLINSSKGISQIEFYTANGVTGKTALVDNVRLHYVEYDSFGSEALQDGDNIVVNLSEICNSDVTETHSNFNDTENKRYTYLVDNYTGETVEYEVVSETRKQLVIRPKTALDAGKEYKVDLPLMSRFEGIKATDGSWIRRDKSGADCAFVAKEDDQTIVLNNDCTANPFITNGANTAVTLEDGAVKVVDTNTTGTVEIHYSQNGKDNGVTTTSATSRYLDASVAFKPTAVTTYGHIFFEFNSKHRYNFKLVNDGTVRMAADANATVNGNEPTPYNINQWNTLGIRYDKVSDTYTAYVNGVPVYTTQDSKFSTGAVNDSLKIYYRTDQSATGTTLYLDDIYVANSCTGVADSSIAWTKTSAETATATVTFDEALAADYQGSPDNFKVTYGESETNLVTSVAYDADSKTATLTLSDAVLSGKEYNLSVSGITDAYGKAVVPYTAKFTTKDLVISDLAIVNADGSAIESAPTSVKATASVDGRGEGVIFIAQYNGGKLTGITPVTKAVLSGAINTTDYTINTEATGDLKLKAFVWDSMDNLRPLCSAVTYPAD